MRNRYFFLFLGAAVFMAGLAYAQSKQMAVDLMINQLLEAKEPQEKGKLKDPSSYRIPYISETYQIAADNRAALDKQYCYCHCALNPRFSHKSLLTCFTDDHGANCGICMSQARETAQMTKAGKTPREIAASFKEKYKDQGSHDHAH